MSLKRAYCEFSVIHCYVNQHGNFMQKIVVIILSFFLFACVSGAPQLTNEQQQKLANLPVLKKDKQPTFRYTVIENITGADCSGAPYGGRVWGDAEKAIYVLKAKAVKVGADAVINTSCGAAPLLNNCWVAKQCTGTAVKKLNE